MRTTTRTLASLMTLSLLTASCTKSATFSLLGDSQNFQQNAVTVNNKIDILWVVDNSGSMDPYQAKLVQNFNSFLANFQNKGFDFQIAVTTSDAYLSGANFYNDLGRSQLKDGAKISGVSNHTGFPLITPTTPNLVPTFITNATQGSTGSGDERAFQSLVETLKNPRNSTFKRPGSFLAVIILSDEDDFSDAIAATAANSRAEGGGNDHDYNSTKLMQTSDLISYLDGVTNSTSSLRNYNISAISVQSSACQTSHAAQSVSTIVGQRYADAATKTNGILGDICASDYSSSLNYIQQRIVELSTEFVLQTTPDPTTLVVKVDGAVVPQDATNGWTYITAANAIQFHGTAVPSASAGISINFTPTVLR